MRLALTPMALSAALLLPLCTSAAGQEVLTYPDALGLIDRVNLMTEDQVSGDCSTNIDAIKSKSKLAFISHNIAVRDIRMFPLVNHPNMMIIAFGGRSAGGLCFGSIELKVSYVTQAHITNSESSKTLKVFVNADAFSREFVGVDSNNLNEQFDDFVEGAVAELIAGVLAGREIPKVERARGRFPTLFERGRQ